MYQAQGNAVNIHLNASTMDVLVHLSNETTAEVGARRRSLNQLNITPELLSSCCQKNLQKVAEAHHFHQKADIPKDVALEKALFEREMASIKCIVQCLHKSNAANEVLVSKLQDELEIANEEYQSMNIPVDEEKDQLQRSLYFVKKQDEYVKRTVALQENIIKSGFPAFGQYKTVTEYANNVNTCKMHLAELSSMLKKYKELPPNIQEAKVKITEAKARLKGLDQQLNQKINANL